MDKKKNLERAMRSLRSGNIVLVFDDAEREAETDMVVAAEHCTPHHVKVLRKEAGGLICAALHPRVAKALELPFLTDIYQSAVHRYPVLGDLAPTDIPYDERSSFTIPVNHRKTFTGITDRDRALTIRELAKLAHKVEEGLGKEYFGLNFRSPGHVHLLRAADGLVAERRGHTELTTALAELAGITPVVAICEMMDDDGGALSKKKAIKYAEAHNMVFLEGCEIVDAYLGKNKGSGG
ncbi:MAG: 3,4-dihydroxy-2-butanone-4-phosphate synthase [Methanobacteriota archaeon]|nr:MAG: 3,4-dihydroxy-2-butanone-4-phosphate synthase [Euryarchaeota archaeon]